MADLGVINYTNVNQGTRGVDRSAESRGLGQILETGKGIVDEAITASVTGDMLDAINQELATSTVEDSPVLEFDKGSREEYLSQRMDKLHNVIAQGSKSQQTAAEIQIKGILAEAQTKYPWLYDNLRSRANSVISGSVAYQQLGIDDSLRSANAEQAQQEYDKIVSHARKDWKDGGLGISEELDPRSRLFLTQYKDRQKLRVQEEESVRVLGMALANARMDMYNPEAYETITEALQGSASTMRTKISGLMVTKGFYQAIGAVGKTDAESVRILDEWAATKAPILTRELQQMRQEMRDLFNSTLTPEHLETEKGKILKTRFEDQLAEIDEVITLVNSQRDELPDAMKQMDKIFAIRNLDTFHGLDKPAQDFSAFISSPVGKAFIEVGNMYNNPEGAVLRRDVSIAAQTAFGKAMDLFPGDPQPGDKMPGGTTGSLETAAWFNSSGALNIAPGAKASDILKTIEQRFRDPTSTFVLPGSGTELSIQALHTIEVHDESFKALFDQASGLSSMASPEYADNTLLGMTFGLAYMNGDKLRPRNIESAVLARLASPSVSNALDVSAKGLDPEKRRAFAQAAEDYYRDSNPAAKREEAAQHYKNKLIGNQALSELVSVKLDALKEGEFEYVIDPDALTKAAQDRIARSAGLINVATPAALAKEKRAIERVIADEMTPIERTMRQQLAIEANIAKARGSSRSQEFFALFSGEGDSSGELGAWMDVFNYTR